jgi:hypothetical protein
MAPPRTFLQANLSILGLPPRPRHSMLIQPTPYRRPHPCVLTLMHMNIWKHLIHETDAARGGRKRRVHDQVVDNRQEWYHKEIRLGCAGQLVRYSTTLRGDSMDNKGHNKTKWLKSKSNKPSSPFISINKSRPASTQEKMRPDEVKTSRFGRLPQCAGVDVKAEMMVSNARVSSWGLSSVVYMVVPVGCQPTVFRTDDVQMQTPPFLQNTWKVMP